VDTESKIGWGLGLWIGGKVGLLLGLLLSLTGIGACLGIPLVLACVPCIILGVVLYFQGRSQKAQEVIAAGVRQGIIEAQAHNVEPQPRQDQLAALASRTQPAAGELPVAPAEVVPLHLPEPTTLDSRAPAPNSDPARPEPPDPSSLPIVPEV